MILLLALAAGTAQFVAVGAKGVSPVRPERLQAVRSRLLGAARPLPPRQSLLDLDEGGPSDKEALPVQEALEGLGASMLLPEAIEELSDEETTFDKNPLLSVWKCLPERMVAAGAQEPLRNCFADVLQSSIDAGEQPDPAQALGKCDAQGKGVPADVRACLRQQATAPFKKLPPEEGCSSPVRCMAVVKAVDAEWTLTNAKQGNLDPDFPTDRKQVLERLLKEDKQAGKMLPAVAGREHAQVVQVLDKYGASKADFLAMTLAGAHAKRQSLELLLRETAGGSAGAAGALALAALALV